MPKTILVVDDELEVAKALRRLLRRDFTVEIAQSGAEALQKLEQAPIDLVISDFRMPGMNGAELLAQVKQRYATTMRLILSGYADIESVLASVNEGEICRFLKKPWDDAELLATLRRVLEGQELIASLAQPFRSKALSASVETSEVDGVARILVRRSSGSFDRPLAMSLLSRFLGAMEDTQVELVGGLLERNAGRISVTVNVGGEQSLTLEVPVRHGAAAGTEEQPC